MKNYPHARATFARFLLVSLRPIPVALDLAGGRWQTPAIRYKAIAFRMKNASSNLIELPGLRVTVDKVTYEPDAQTPPDRPHCFAYFITIHNDSATPVTIKGRKWVVTNSRGEVLAVEGDGVVGQFPTIEPGESFSYNSCHLLDAPWAVAEGSYLGLDGESRRVFTRIPRFKMTAPK
jgi:ApaG protein